MVGHRVVVNPDSRLAKHARALSWPILELKRASIKEARKRVQREARQSIADANAAAQESPAEPKKKRRAQ
jgi:hypothetical protein